jgi:cytochrome bd ubiquinol oxidase subunit I
VTKADGVWITFTAIVVLYAALGTALILTLRAMARRWRANEEPEVPYGPSDTLADPV